MSEQLGELLGPRNPESNSILGPRNPRTQADTDRIANYLVDKFASPEHRPFFLKVAWRFSEAAIAKLVELALERGTNPRAYFIRSVKNNKDYYAK
jgi:hypothetical protein